MDYYGKKVLTIVNQTLRLSNELEKYIINCRSYGGNWNDDVSESYLKYTALIIERSNNLLSLSNKTKDVESNINVDKIESFGGTVQSLESELNSI